MHGGGTTQLAPVVCEQKYMALQADVVCVGSQSFAHFLFTGFRVFGKDSEASGDSGATRWNSLNPLSHQMMEKYPGEPPDQLCLHPLMCNCGRSFYCANPLRLGIYLLPKHSTTYPDLLPFWCPGQRSLPLWSFPWLTCAGRVSDHSLDHAPIVLWTYS